jgi:hypothetical protein
MIFEIPVLKDTAAWQQRTSLDGIDYILEFNWNGRANSWFLTMFEADGTALLESVKLVSNWPLLQRRRATPNLPPGEFFLFDPTYTISSANYEQLGDEIKLFYFDEEELAT